MAAQERHRNAYVVESLAIDDSAYVAIVTPIDCAYWSARPASDAYISSNPDDVTQEDSLPAGTQEMCVAPPMYGPTRYRAGDIVAYVKSVAGAQTVSLRFLN